MIIRRYGLEEETEEGEEAEDRRTKEKEKAKFRIAFCNMNLTLKDGNAAPIPNFEFLHVGSIGSAYNKDKLKAQKITHILCLSQVIRLMFTDDFIYQRTVMIDKPDFNVSSVLDECFVFIEQVRKIHEENEGQAKLLVHCMQGKSRCISVCCAYLIKYHKYTYKDALSAIKEVRPIADPNSGFRAKLKEMELSSLSETT